MKITTTVVGLLILLSSCNNDQKNTAPDPSAVAGLNLKRGDIVACGPPEKEFGTVEFTSSCSAKSEKDFNLGMALLHSFEYDEAEKAFAAVIDTDPSCAMGYWGVAMSNYHPVWPSAPLPEEIEKGSKAIFIAQSLQHPSAIVTDYINAIAAFYKDWTLTTHREHGLAFSAAMEQMYKKYSTNKEVALFYALSLVSVAEPTDKTYANQKKAAAILKGLYPGQPTHPGIVHYIIHSYDSPELASLALDAARQYASIAPSSAHAQHMPSHIFTRLGLWDESIRSNKAAAASAKCYAENTGLQGHWDEELHAIDYLVYAYLQQGENTLAKEQVDYLESFSHVSPVNFKVLYAFAASPCRYFLENKMWKEAAALEPLPGFPWDKYPWQKAIVHFTRLLGAAQTGDPASAKKELSLLQQLHESILAQKDTYKANQVLIQIRTGEAWISFAEGNTAKALEEMSAAAEMEDKTEKAPVTPGEVLPARQLLADMLMKTGAYAEALAAYEADLAKHPRRFNSLYGAAQANEKAGNKAGAKKYYGQLLEVAGKSNRQEILLARSIIKGN